MSSHGVATLRGFRRVALRPVSAVFRGWSAHRTACERGRARAVRT